MKKYISEDDYIEKYGHELGPIKYQNLLHGREKRKYLKEKNISIKINNTEQDIIDGNAIKCKECGSILTRIQWTHLKSKCIGQVKSLKEYSEKYPGSLTVAPNLSKNTSQTLEKMIVRWGEEIGLKKWNHYCNKQSETNTFEYKLEKYGWTKEQFDEYNKSRAVTLNNIINRHGEEAGLEIWNHYCNRQRETCSLEHFIKIYGEDGPRRYSEWRFKFFKSSGAISKLQTSIYEILKLKLDDLSDKIIISNNKTKYYFDMGNDKLKKIIEVNGTFWHMDPRFYKKDEINLRTKRKAQDVWDYDFKKNSEALNQGYQIYIIWEHDWHNNKEKIIENILKWWANENINTCL